MFIETTSTFDSSLDSKYYFEAETTTKQLSSFEERFSTTGITNELFRMDLSKIYSKASEFKLNGVEMCLKRAWNKEIDLWYKRDKFQNLSENPNHLIPQCYSVSYYSVFNSIMAMYKAVGFTEESHTSVLKRYGELAITNKLPHTVSLAVTGFEGNYTYFNVNQSETESCSTYQALRTTRKKILYKKREDHRKNFTSSKGKHKKRLSRDDWDILSKKAGATTVIDYLYRKRIKSDYRDVSGMCHSKVRGDAIYKSLVHITSSLNLVNETIICSIIGYQEYHSIAFSLYEGEIPEHLQKRLKIVKQITNSR